MANKSSRSERADKQWNARRRYIRAAERNLKKAENLQGATAARYKELARQDFESAISTYSPNELSKGIRSKSLMNMSEEFGYNADVMKGINQRRYTNDLNILTRESEQKLESVIDSVGNRRETEARALLNDDAIGSRILGGLVDVWKDAATIDGKVDNSKILPAIYEHFGIDNLADLVDILEQEIGSSLYSMKGDLDNIYEAVKIMIQTKVRDGSLVV